MKKRILALLLVLSMLVSMVPTVFAADAEQLVEKTETANWEFWKGIAETAQTFDQHFSRTDTVAARKQWTWENGSLTLAGHSGWGTAAAKLNGTTNDFYDNYTVQFDFRFNSYHNDNDGRDGLYIYPVNSGANEYPYSVTIWDQYKVRLSVNDGVQLLHYTTQFPTSSGAVVTSFIPEDNGMPQELKVNQVYSLYLTLSGQTLTVKLSFVDENGQDQEYTYVHTNWEYAQDDVTGRFNFTYVDTASGSPGNESVTLSNFEFTAPVSLKATVADAELVVGDTTTVEATDIVVNEDIFGETAVKYTSEDDTVVTVNETTGAVTAVGEGTTNVVATLSDSNGNTLSAKVAVEVDPAPVYVAKIGTQGFETFAAAMNAANAMTGDVVVDIYGEVEFVNGMELKNGSYSSITFNGKDNGAKMTINQTAGGDYLEAHGKTVAFNDLILAKKNPAWSGNAGHMGNYFSIQGGTVTYTNCTFLNGACTSSGTAVYNSCTFQNASEYGLWVYDDALVTVNGGIINSKKGIKVYSEGEDSVTSTLTVQNATFTENVTAKPAVAIGYAESITLIGNTYNNPTDVLELDSGSDADCEGVTFVAEDAEGNDIASTLTAVDRSNGNAACGVLMDGKIYTSVTEAANDAEIGDTVVLLFDTTEEVELPDGVSLDLNGYTADNVVCPVFLIGSGTEEDPYLINNVADLKLFAEKVDGGNTFAGKFFKLTADIDLYEMGAGEPVTFNTIGDSAHPFSGTFDGDGHTISNLYQSGWAFGYEWGSYGSIGLFGSIDGATIKNLTIKNAECFVEGGDVGGIAGSATGDCVFENITITDSVMATYNNGCGGIIGWAGEGSYTFKGVTVDEDTVIAGLWGSFDSSLGGVMGQLDRNATAHFEDVDVSCRLDAYNDITASYKYYNYRMCGMLIGRVLAVDENGKLDPAANGITLGDNVVVTFGDWANYNYINNKVNGYGWQRVEPGYAYDGVDVTKYPDAEIIYQTFDKLFSGDQYGGYGVDSYTDPSGKSVTVIAPPDVLSYVSIGDSMANGYCFEGYEQGEEGKINFFAGTGVYGKGAYPLQFERWLQEQGQAVDHTKLAPSAMRAEDLNYLLGGREMPNDDWYDEVNGYTEVYDNEKLKEFFQTAVTDADIITMGVGNASFGAYMLHRVTDALGVLGGNLSDAEKVTLEQALVGLDEEQKSIVLEVYNTMMAQLKAYVPAELAEQFHVEDICNIVAYTVAGFILNYEGSLEQIVALNPDVEVILVGLMNTTYGMEITGEGVSVPVGDIMDEVFGALNAYIAALPAVKQANGEWADATFYYAEQPNPKFISQVFDELKAGNWENIDEGRLSGDIVRDRNIDAFNSLAKEIMGQDPGLDLSIVERYEAAYPVSGPEGGLEFYLGLEAAVADSCDTMEIPVESLITIATDIGGIFEGINFQTCTRDEIYRMLTANDAMKGMCKIYALFKIGNGMSVHPTPAGHDEIADAVIAAYENGYTAEDATKDNIEEYAKKALWLITEYYDDVYAIVYDKLDEQGYVAASVAALEYVKAQIAAIDVDALELSDAMKAELKEEAALAMEAIEALQNLLLTADELDDETVKAAQALLDDLTDALENMNDILAVAGTDLESAVKHQLSVLDAAVRAQISAAIERAETALENLKKYIDEDIAPAVRAEIEELIETIEGQLEYLQAVVDGTVEATIDQINKALAALEQAVTDLIKTAQNEADQLLQAMLDELKALAEATVAEFEAALYEATHISMSIYDDQYYVSLGGATANGAGVGRTDKIYSDLVVEALEAEGIDVEFKDLTKADLAYDGLVDYVKANAAEIAKATLITYNMDASGFLMSLFGNDPDWSAYFDEAEVKAAIEEIQAEVLALQSKLAAELDAEALAALAQAEDDVLAALTEQIDLDTAKEIAPYAEKLLYAAVSYAVETAKALEAIQTINPEAEIMLVGMYNPLAGTTVTVKGEVINLGEIVEYAMEATDLYHLIYAVANDKVAFVDVSETTVDGLGNLNVDDPKTMINSLAAALMNASAKISANAAGHAYIAEQIIGAIDFVGMLGDINLDGEVDTADAVAAVDAWLGKIELNELQKNNGDVNFDGTVDAADAALIVDFWLGKIQSFEK